MGEIITIICIGSVICNIGILWIVIKLYNFIMGKPK